jgi:hypothetical protein
MPSRLDNRVQEKLDYKIFDNKAVRINNYSQQRSLHPPSNIQKIKKKRKQ